MSSVYQIFPDPAHCLGAPLRLSWIAVETEEDFPDLAQECELSELEEGRVRRVKTEERLEFRRFSIWGLESARLEWMRHVLC